MAKFNRPGARARGQGPIAGEQRPTGTTYEGAPGYARDARSELFLLAVANMVGENTFYEGAGERDSRFQELIARLAVEDVAWLAGLLGWLRGEANMRSAAVVGALEAARARQSAGAHGHSRRIVDSVLQRADEPGEALAYWLGRYGRTVPKPVKRGIADAARRMYSERSLLKYDTDTRGFRFGDVCELTHPVPRDPRQGALFAHAISRRRNRDDGIDERLSMLRARQELFALPMAERRAVLDAPDGVERLARAGVTWEALAGWLQGPMDAAAWEAILPSMGYMAKLRNLRNFDRAGVSGTVAAQVAATLADPEEVARSRQLPMRFLAAYRAAPSLRWGDALEQALQHSLQRVPRLPGRTLILVDRSGSMMGGRISQRSQLNAADSAAIFGSALALRAEQADLVQFGTNHSPVAVRDGDALLRVCERFGNLGGTNTAAAVRDNYRGHDRVVIVTDEQVWAGRRGQEPTDAVPAEVPVYTWNLVGFRRGHGPAGAPNRHVFGGLSDAAFAMIPLIEAGVQARWPWEDSPAA